MPSRAEDDNPKVKEFLTLFPEGRVEDGVVLQMAKCHKGPRIIKTHLQIDLLNHDLLDTCKVCASVLMKKNIASLRRIWTCVCCFFFFFLISRHPLLVYVFCILCLTEFVFVYSKLHFNTTSTFGQGKEKDTYNIQIEECVHVVHILLFSILPRKNITYVRLFISI